jgi:hypothetical protein
VIAIVGGRDDLTMAKRIRRKLGGPVANNEKTRRGARPGRVFDVLTADSQRRITSA